MQGFFPPGAASVNPDDLRLMAAIQDCLPIGEFFGTGEKPSIKSSRQPRRPGEASSEGAQNLPAIKPAWVAAGIFPSKIPDFLTGMSLRLE